MLDAYFSWGYNICQQGNIIHVLDNLHVRVKRSNSHVKDHRRGGVLWMLLVCPKIIRATSCTSVWIYVIDRMRFKVNFSVKDDEDYYILCTKQVTGSHKDQGCAAWLLNPSPVKCQRNHTNFVRPTWKDVISFHTNTQRFKTWWYVPFDLVWRYKHELEF